MPVSISRLEQAIADQSASKAAAAENEEEEVEIEKPEKRKAGRPAKKTIEKNKKKKDDKVPDTSAKPLAEDEEQDREQLMTFIAKCEARLQTSFLHGSNAETMPMHKLRHIARQCKAALNGKAVERFMRTAIKNGASALETIAPARARLDGLSKRIEQEIHLFDEEVHDIAASSALVISPIALLANGLCSVMMDVRSENIKKEEEEVKVEVVM
jgi:hypothetical protein